MKLGIFCTALVVFSDPVTEVSTPQVAAALPRRCAHVSVVIEAETCAGGAYTPTASNTLEA
jgi:hypothetical protein